jgi:GNAT superfamily N-acetyltransferase
MSRSKKVKDSTGYYKSSRFVSKGGKIIGIEHIIVHPEDGEVFVITKEMAEEVDRKHREKEGTWATEYLYRMHHKDELPNVKRHGLAGTTPQEAHDKILAEHPEYRKEWEDIGIVREDETWGGDFQGRRLYFVKSSKVPYVGHLKLRVEKDVADKYGGRIEEDTGLPGDFYYDEPHAIPPEHIRVQSGKKWIPITEYEYNERKKKGEWANTKKKKIKQPWEMTRSEFRKYQLTGYIPSSAYQDYRTTEGISWLKKEKHPKLYSEKEFGDKKVEFRKSGDHLEYTKIDKDGEIIRDNNHMAIMLTDDEAKAKGYPIESRDITAFYDGKPIGWASDEFGATGVFVVDDFQKLGIGKYLLSEYRKGMPFSRKLGQATEAGYNLAGSWHNDLVKQALIEGKHLSTKVKRDYGKNKMAKGTWAKKKQPWEMTVEELGTLYHGGKAKIDNVDFSKTNQRDYGFYGKGFYTTTNKKYARSYGGRISEIKLSDDARILKSSLKPEDAPIGFTKEVMRDYYKAVIPRVKELGREKQLKDELKSIKVNPIEWSHAVYNYAKRNGYNVVRHSDGEIVILDKSALREIGGTWAVKKPCQMTREEFGSAYHGTNEEFDKFELKRATGAQGLTSKYGVWFTNNKDEASQYAQLAGSRNYQNQIEYESRIGKLIKQSEKFDRQGNYDKSEQLILEAERLESEMRSIKPKEVVKDVVLPKNLMEYDSVEVFNSTEMEDVIKKAINSGYEGVKFTNIEDSPFGLGKGTTQSIIFNPEKILNVSHKSLVEKALTKGKPISASVLKDYADLYQGKKKGAWASEYLYHGTNEGRARNIAKKGLLSGEKAGNTMAKAIYLSDTEQYAKSYADRKGGSTGVILRIKKTPSMIADKDTGLKGDYKVEDGISPENIEIKTHNGWRKLTDYGKEVDGTWALKYAPMPLQRSAGLHRKVKGQSSIKVGRVK